MQSVALNEGPRCSGLGGSREACAVDQTSVLVEGELGDDGVRVMVVAMRSLQ